MRDIFLSRLYDVILMDIELFIAFYLIMKIDSCNFTQLFKMLVVKNFWFCSLFFFFFVPNLGIRGYRVNNGKTVMLETKSHNTIYKALNLNGLCVQKWFFNNKLNKARKNGICLILPQSGNKKEGLFCSFTAY